jgi:hypothetical protein
LSSRYGYSDNPQHGGHEIPVPEDDPFIKVSVLGGKAEHYRDKGKLSKYFSHKPLSKITNGKPGGYKGGDDWF